MRGILPYFGIALDIYKKGLYPFIKENGDKNGGIFTAYLFGARIHIITDPTSYQTIQRKPKIFSFTPLMHEMAQRMNNETVQKTNIDTTKLRETTMSVSKYLQGDPLEQVSKVYGRLVMEKLNEYFDKNNVNGELVVNLHSFVRTILFYASSKSILGEEFDSEATEKDFFTFDDNLKFIVNGFPGFLVQHAHAAKARVEKAIMNLDFSKACEFVSAQREGKTELELARIGFGMLNASQTNSIHASFWTFYDILKDNKTKQNVIDEISDKFSVEAYEETIDSMEYLQAAYLESNRFHNIGISLRQAVEDCKVEVGSKSYKLRKGDRIFMMPTSYQDPEIFENPSKYDPERFVGKKISDKVKNSQIPYGGGIHLCPGRFFAINEIKLFTILMLKHFNCDLVEKKEVENNYQSVSYLSPLGDIKMKMTRIK